jgi:hypothetical protein
VALEKEARMPSAGTGAKEKITDGMAAYLMAVNDRGSLQLGAVAYKSVASEVESLIRAEDVCKLAFPSMIVRPDIRIECLVVVLQDRLIIAWKAGLIRKTVHSMVIPFTGITGIRREKGTSAATRRATLLVISGEQSATIALPTDKMDAAMAVIRTAIGPVGG